MYIYIYIYLYINAYGAIFGHPESVGSSMIQ